MQTIVMPLKNILEKLEFLNIQGNPDREISGVQYDSRRLSFGEAFVAIKGFTENGHRYIPNAHEKGVRVFFVEEAVDLPDSTVVYVENTRKTLPEISRIFYNFPDKKLDITGITGTNGKTTVAYLIHSILQAAQRKAGLITTVESYNGSQWVMAERTTPESLDLHRMFYNMVQNDCDSAVMEVSSHALSLHRVEGIRFGSAVFTNLGRDHLDFHETQQDYFLAKRKLFEKLESGQKVFLNEDDPYSYKIKEITGGQVFTFSMKRPAATVYCKNHEIVQGRTRITLRTPLGEIRLTTRLLGEFNIYNILAAATVTIEHSIEPDTIIEGINNQNRIKGRCESYHSPAGFTVYLDYAHTPDALRNFLQAIRQTLPKHLYVVFGGGGDRDKGKRPLMGQAAENYADRIILTNDNPRSEDPNQIISDILSGINDKSKVLLMPDREDAIHLALGMAGDDDAVVIAGKGHETYQEIGGKRINFDDREVIRSFFKKQDWTFPV